MDAETTERGLPPRTPETVSSVGDGSNSAGKSATTASLSQSKEQSKVVPHYLSPSKGSCHDFCKYGRKHSLRLRGKYHRFPSFAGSRSAPEKENHRVKIPSLAEKRKKSAARQKSSAHLKTGLCDKHVMLEEGSASPADTIKLTEESEIIDRFLESYGLSVVLEATDYNLPSPSKKIEPCSESESSKRGTAMEGTVLCDDPELSPEGMSLLATKAEAPRDPDTAKKATKKVGAFSSIKSKLAQKVPSPLKKALSSGKSKASDLEVSASSAKRPDAFAKPGSSGKPKDTTAKSMPPLNPTSGTASKKSEIRSTRNVDLPKHDDKKNPKPPPSSLSSQPILNRISSFSLRRVRMTSSSSVRRPKNLEKAKEESPNAAEPRAEVDKTSVARRPSGVPNPGKKHKVPEPASVGKQGGGTTLVARAVQTEDKKSRRKAATSHPGDGDPASSKPELRRGKVADPQSVDDVARRIWFRQGRRAGDNPGGKSGRRSIRIRDRGARAAANPPRPGGEIVVLRHQDAPEREVQGLFNEVIEETAKKLSKGKKSKVRALVGAFETVISLQEALRFDLALVKPQRSHAS